MSGEWIRDVLSRCRRFCTRFRTDGQRSCDTESTAYSSSLLEISEYEFFRIGYFQWYGTEIQEKNLESDFASYMDDEKVPHYVRHCARNVISLFCQGRLVPEQFNVPRQKALPGLRAAGAAYAVLLALILLLFCSLIKDYHSY